MIAEKEHIKRYPHAISAPPLLNEEIGYLFTALSYQNQLLADILAALTALVPAHDDDPAPT